MYHALLAFRTDFISIYELLAEDNDRNIPVCKNKEGGLLKIFLDKIPFEYGKRTFQSLATYKFKDRYKSSRHFTSKCRVTKILRVMQNSSIRSSGVPSGRKSL